MCWIYLFSQAVEIVLLQTPPIGYKQRDRRKFFRTLQKVKRLVLEV